MTREVQMAQERGEFIHLEDGYQYYAPQGSGALSARVLRLIADELDKRNKDWDDKLIAALGVSDGA